MEIKTARLTLLIDPDKKAAFERLCAERPSVISELTPLLHGEAEHPVPVRGEVLLRVLPAPPNEGFGRAVVREN